MSEDAISLSRTSSVDAKMTNGLHLIVLRSFCSGGGDETSELSQLKYDQRFKSDFYLHLY